MFHRNSLRPASAATLASVGGPLLVPLTVVNNPVVNNPVVNNPVVNNPVRRSGRMASSGK